MVRLRRAVIGSTLAAAVAAAALAGAATGAKKPATRSLTASGTALKYSTSALTAPGGPVKLVFTNRSGTFKHSIAIKGNGIATRKGKVVGRNGTTSVAATLAPGRYTYFCTVENHAKKGMKGTLTVTR